MSTYVPGSGNPDARLMIVGEAPGGEEELQLLPFVGPSGEILWNELLAPLGVFREDVYTTNVVKVRPPDNDLKKLHLIGRKIEDFLPELWEEIKEINPNCILALGGTALKYLTGYEGITKYRGSILPNKMSALPKVVATLHPASLLHSTVKGEKASSWKALAYMRKDTERAVQQSTFHDLILPTRQLIIAYNSLDVIRFLEGKTKSAFCTVDVETFKTLPLCIAVAFDRYTAMSIPLLNLQTATNPEGIPLQDMAYIWKVVGEFLLDTKVKIAGQNLKFDERICEWAKIPFHNIWFDLMLAWHTCYPEFPKRLEFISSILTEEPYYKDEGKEYNPKKDKLSRLLHYNAKDAVVEFECVEKVIQELEELGLTDFFFNQVMPLHRMYYNIESVGMKVDFDCRERMLKEAMEEEKRIDDRITEILGHPLNVNSPKVVYKTLYEELGIPRRKDVSEETLLALMANVVKRNPKHVELLKNILLARKVKKNRGTYLEAGVCADNRMRTQYRITGTESGRTSTSKLEPPISILRQGIAFQTMTKYGEAGRELRRMFVADDGYIMVESDLSQAEDRVTCNLAADWEALKVLDKTDFKYNQHGVKDDRHTLTTMLCMGVGFEYVTSDLRQVGKRGRHAFNYDVGKHELMLTVNTDLAKMKSDLRISEWRAGQILQAIDEISPNIRKVYHAEVRRILEETRTLITPFGRRRMFFDRWGNELFKEAYSYIPQSTVADHMKASMLRIWRRVPEVRFLVESHDGFLCEIPLDLLHTLCQVIKEELETSIDFSKCSISRPSLRIPCEIQVGFNWKDMEKYVVGKTYNRVN